MLCLPADTVLGTDFGLLLWSLVGSQTSDPDVRPVKPCARFRSESGLALTLESQ